MGGIILTDTHHDWVATTLGVDPRAYAGADASAGAAASDGNARPHAAGKPTRKQVAKTPVNPTPDWQNEPLVLKGTVRKVQSDLDNPFSAEVEVFDIDMPTLSEPMPKVRPRNDVIIKYLQDIPEFASARAVGYCQSVAEACESFEKYTRKRVKVITKPEFGADTIFGALLGVVATVVTGGLGGAALKGFGKAVADKVKDAIKDVMVEQGGKAFKAISGKESTAEELTEMAEALSAEVRRRASRIKDAVASDVSAQTDPLIQKLLSGGKLSKNEDALILPFAAADGAGKDRLYRQLGVPDLASSKSVKLNLFGQLTWKFEDQIWETKAKDDVERGKSQLANAKTPEDKKNAEEFIRHYEDQAKHNARATALNAWIAYKEENT